MTIQPVKPRSHYNHYSNSASQGALICQTSNWPTEEYVEGVCDYGSEYNCYYKIRRPKSNNKRLPVNLPNDLKVSSAYSDRIAMWDYQHYQKLCEMIGTGEQGWDSRLVNYSDDKLLEIAKFGLKISGEVLAARFVHYFNVATGYSCPTIEAIYKEP